MKILFVGNSHTYMNDMPELVRLNSQAEITVTMLARPYVTFNDHLQSQELQFALKQDFDYVIFQQAAHVPCPSRAETLQDGKKLIDLARACGVIPYILIPWPPAHLQPEFTVIKDTYHQLMIENGVDGIPAGYVIEGIAKQYPSLQLYQADQQHLNPLGSYLEAITVINSLWQQTTFKNKGLKDNENSFEETNLKLDQGIIDTALAILDEFKANYCVCGKRERL